MILPVTKLESTSDHVIQIVKPIYYNNVCYGICGFEMSANYFKTHFAQPTQLGRLTCLLTRTDENEQTEYLINEGFSAGILKGYYLAPDGDLKVEKYNSTLYKLTAEASQIGVIRKIKICDSYFDLVTMIPKKVFDKEVISNSVQFTLLSIMLLFIVVTCSIFFSRRFLTPIIKALEAIKNQEHIDATSKVSEIDDLFQYLSNQDKLADEEMSLLKKELEHYIDMVEKHSKEVKQKQNEVERLAYCRKNEVDPDDYLAFKQGLKTLTKTEKMIFKMYLNGKSAKDIMNELNIQESTIKYHNHNLLEKLNVSTRKQMLRYALILKQEEKDRQNKE